VAALVAVYEARMAAWGRDEPLRQASRPVEGERKRMVLETLKPLLRRGPLGLLFATFCATSATASFMAYNFHELSPYVLIGNPLTLTIIEIFAVPGALAGALLYPLGLDAFVWRYVRLGIDGVMWADRKLARSDDPPSRLCALGDCFSQLSRRQLALLGAMPCRTAIGCGGFTIQHGAESWLGH
jgi:competence protein ComEC